jgi:prophage DNA circulation protein
LSDSFSALAQTTASALGIGKWYALLRQASFRGASFHVEQGTAASGRRAALHEYPGRDIPYTEDLGRKQWQYSFTAYCVGTIYPFQRDMLLRACTQKGPGTLVHPSFGSKQVICTDCSVVEERQSGNYCSFSLSFVEAGQLQEPNSTTNTTAAVETSAASSIGSTLSDFAKSWGLDGLSSFIDGATADVNSFCDSVTSLTVAPVVGTALTVATAALQGNVGSLLSNAPALGGAVSAVTAAFGSSMAAAPVASGMLTLGSLFTSHTVGAVDTGSFDTRRRRASAQDAAPPSTMTATRQQEALNAAAFQRLVRQLALVEVAYAVPGLILTSSQDAADLRATLTQAFDAAETAAGNAGLDDSYADLVNLENAVIADITQRMLQLPALTSYKFPQSPNALALAWRLYQDAERCDELVDRTNAVNPSFLPNAGRVLSS